MIENWRPIPDFLRYEISDRGQIRNIETGRILKPKRHNHGYRTISLSPGDRQFLIHTLVMRAFVGPRPDGKEVNHINGIKTDNRPCNLEYVTRIENDRHKRLVLGRGNAGIKHGMAKLTREQCDEIRKLRLEGGKLSEIAEKFSISFQHVSDIALGYRRASA